MDMLSKSETYNTVTHLDAHFDTQVYLRKRSAENKQQAMTFRGIF